MTMETTSKKRALHAYVTDAGHQAWHDFADRNGISVSALLEALAPVLAASDVVDVEVELDAVVLAARRIDSSRRRRR